MRQHRFEHTPPFAEAVGQGDRALQVEQHADHRGGLGRRSSMAQRPRHDQVHDEPDQRRHGQCAGERRPERQPAVRQAQPDRDVEGTGQHVQQREDQVACPAQLDELVRGRDRHRSHGKVDQARAEACNDDALTEHGVQRPESEPKERHIDDLTHLTIRPVSVPTPRPAGLRATLGDREPQVTGPIEPTQVGLSTRNS